ncbi:endo-1,4-beta-xylanase [Adhaeribacter aquaticus]|uniref:endo-1,4-beta-xylanase n=1 Tax=Adhaeribacter aquaticus TaxID=299567 RepID=UPI0003FC8C3F|nr:endo-1,4-beta-xylanase [Adhaeribacter aquaticus]
MHKLLHQLVLPVIFLLLNAAAMGQTNPIAKGHPKFLGNIYSNAQRAGFTNYWNQVAPENAGKWGSVEASRDVMNWTELDAAYKLAKDNNLPFRFHVLLWGNQQPAWIENLPAAEQLEEIKEWFAAVAQRYPAIDLLEVVNEPINDPPGSAGNGGGNYINALGGTGASNYDWIVTSFRLARQYFPTTKLMLNEFNIINNTSNLNKYLQIIDLLKAENLLDAVGFQGHAFSTKNTPAFTITNNINLLAATGLPVYVTEMDIDGLNDNIQLTEYQRVFPLFWDHEAIKGVTLWGFRPGLWRDAQGAYLITTNGTERPALTWLRQYVSKSALGIKKAPIQGLAIYPNPIKNKNITISGLKRNTSVKVYDVLGNLVQKEQTLKPGEQEFAINLPSGLYLLHLESEKEQAVQKLIIE